MPMKPLQLLIVALMFAGLLVCALLTLQYLLLLRGLPL
jgi:hypothetical protein